METAQPVNSIDEALFLVQATHAPDALAEFDTANVQGGVLVCLDLGDIIKLISDYKLTFMRGQKYTTVIVAPYVPVVQQNSPEIGV